MTDERPCCILTIGHSNRSFGAFLSLLSEFGVGAVADVRRFPSSRKFPHFNRGSLEEKLHEEGIVYRLFQDLGGRRESPPAEDSPNAGLEVEGFQNYADHMVSPAFQSAVDSLIRLGEELPTVIMCAERLFLNCHRRLLSDFLTARGIRVEHIIDTGRIQRHELSRGAVIGPTGIVTYPRGTEKKGSLW